MTNVGPYFYALVLIAGVAIAPVCYAVCLDPVTGVSGYHVPLGEELRSTEVVVIGNIVQSQSLHEDAADPEDITAYLYRVEILRQVKGHVPETIMLRNENDSGRYPIAVGEEHLLFLHHEGEHYTANSCGNSSLLSNGSAVLHRIEDQLAKSQHAP